MCDHDAKKPLARFFPPEGEAASRTSSSRRQRLWELPANTHCPVIGVCLPLGVLRKLVNKGVRGQALADDYEIHVGAVAECANRNRISNLLQDALDQRYALVLLRFKEARSGEAVMQLWRQAIAQGDVAGAFWAALTHPRSDFLVQDTVLREMHMIQHQAGATTRIDHARYLELQEENAAMAAELAQSQQRHVRTLADKARELEQVQAQLMAARAELVARESKVAFLQADMAELAASVPDLEARTRLKQKLDEAAQRLSARDAQLAQLRQQLAASTRQLDALQAARPADAAVCEEDAAEAIAAAQLVDKTLLCVGGRSASVASYRCMTEEAGARFAHHDGGQEHGADLLDANLAAADLVICQTGCISHNAYWRVKEHCKRTGKQCVFVENPSSTSFSRGLRQIAILAA
ncbi:DUF2325 domain-containing protein [Massilia atriviolacea]|uniref:DUF2325 domain-containing protein n=1 Tax=Massilia atriviolacea TaxID=2495579 RepID=A0A430HJE8_9BURK|nr:DUF2325 domain-containing protein [Massilia atriviolacea]RSZ57609.1 DUF2325 domain-containing protein [Massilia atriviolacea]